MHTRTNGREQASEITRYSGVIVVLIQEPVVFVLKLLLPLLLCMPLIRKAPKSHVDHRDRRPASPALVHCAARCCAAVPRPVLPCPPALASIARSAVLAAASDSDHSDEESGTGGAVCASGVSDEWQQHGEREQPRGECRAHGRQSPARTTIAVVSAASSHRSCCCAVRRRTAHSS